MRTKSLWCAALLAAFCVLMAYKSPAPITTGPNNTSGGGGGGPPTGAAGGALSGTYPNPGIASPLPVLDASLLTNINVTNVNSTNLVPPGSVLTNDPLGGVSLQVVVPASTFCMVVLPATPAPTLLNFVINGTSSHDTTNGTTIAVSAITNKYFLWTNTLGNMWIKRAAANGAVINVAVYSLGVTTNNYTTQVGQYAGYGTFLLGPGTSIQGVIPTVMISNTDIGQTSVMDFQTNADPVNAAFNQWTNRFNALHFPTNSTINSTPQILSAPFDGFTAFGQGSISMLDVEGKGEGSVWRWNGANAAMLSHASLNNTPAVDFNNITLLNNGTGTNAGYVQAGASFGGVGKIDWNNVNMVNWNIGAVIFNSVGYFYGLQNLGCGIGEFFGQLSDGQIVHVRSINNTNASLVFNGRGIQADYNAANDQIGIVVGSGGGNLLKVSAENVSNCVVAIGYPPVSVFPQQGLTVTPGAISGNRIGYGYIQGNTTNSSPTTDGFSSAIKLYTNSTWLDVDDLNCTLFNGPVVWSRVTVADTTPISFEGVSSASNLVIFSDLTTLPAAAANTRYGVNIADSEYTGSTLEWNRGTNGNVSHRGGENIGGNIVISNTITSYNGETTAGVGIPYQETANANAVGANQTGSSGATTFFTTAATGEYLLETYVTTKTSGTSGTFTIALTWTDEYGAHTNTSPILTFATGSNPYIQFTTFVHATTTTVFNRTTTFNSPIGSPAIDYYIRTLRLN